MRMNMLCRQWDNLACHWIWVSRCYWGQIVWSIMFLLSIPHNLLGLVRKNWSGWRSEYQDRQALGFPYTLVCAGMSGLVLVYSRSSDGHSGGASIYCASTQSSVVWG